MRNVFCLLALCVTLPFAVPCTASVSLPPPLNEAALKASVLTRLNTLLVDQGRGDAAQKITADAIGIDKLQPVQVGAIELYAVKLSLRPEDPLVLPETMTLLTDASGTMQFGMVADLATGQEAAMSQAADITRVDLPEHLPKVLSTGSGIHEVVLISDPFCPYCREAASYLLDNLHHIATLKLVHLPLPMHPGADAATWIMEYSRDAQDSNADPLAVMRYAYTGLQAPAQELSADVARKEVVAQFLTQFPALARGAQDKSPEALLYYLKGRYEAETVAAISALQRLQITGTPYMVVDGKPVRGFDKSLLEKLLTSVSQAKK